MTFVVYVTGDIGAGKSSVTDSFARCGADTLKADEVVSHLYETDGLMVTELQDVLGDECFPSGTPDKAMIAQKIFSNPELKSAVEAVIHPRVKLETQRRIRESQADVFVYEIPIITSETDLSDVDEVLTVTADDDVRLHRLLNRGMNTADARTRILHQKLDHSRRRNFREVHNDGSIFELDKKVAELFEEFKSDTSSQ